MLLHYHVNALSVSCTRNRWPSAPRNTRHYSARPVASKYPRSEPSRLQDLGYKIYQHRLYQTKIRSVDERRWLTPGVALNNEQSTIDMHWPGTGAEEFERASILKEDNSNTTSELTILILSVSVTFSVTFVWLLLLPCYIFHWKSVPETSTIIGLQECLFYKVVQRQNQGMVADFILLFGADICCLTCRKNIKIGQQLPKLQAALSWMTDQVA